MNNDSLIYIADHEGFVGGAIVEKLKLQGYSNLLLRTRQELDLKDQEEVESFFGKFRPEFIFLVASKSGGILANINQPADFIYENLTITSNIIHSSVRYGAKRILFLGASCIYPKEAPQPITEEYFLKGELEQTSEAYAVAKIAGIEMSKAYQTQYGTGCISAVPATVYGPHGNFDQENSHVIGALIKKFHEAKTTRSKEVVIWGTGKPKREFIYIDDLAEACVFLMQQKTTPELINIGSGEEISIGDLALLIKRLSGFEGRMVFDKSKPDGVSRKLLDSTKIRKMGFRAKVALDSGLKETYNWYKDHQYV